MFRWTWLRIVPCLWMQGDGAQSSAGLLSVAKPFTWGAASQQAPVLQGWDSPWLAFTPRQPLLTKAIPRHGAGANVGRRLFPADLLDAVVLLWRAGGFDSRALARTCQPAWGGRRDSSSPGVQVWCSRGSLCTSSGSTPEMQETPKCSLYIMRPLSWIKCATLLMRDRCQAGFGAGRLLPSVSSCIHLLCFWINKSLLYRAWSKAHQSH